MKQYRLLILYHVDRFLKAIPAIDIINFTYDEWQRPVTELIVKVPDQAALVGLLNEIHGQGMEFLTITTIT